MDQLFVRHREGPRIQNRLAKATKQTKDAFITSGSENILSSSNMH